MHFTEKDFYRQKEKTDKRWLFAAVLAVCAHLAVMLVIKYMPGIFKPKPIVEEVVSVSFVQLSEKSSGPPPSAASPKEPDVKKTPAKVAPKPPPSPPKTTKEVSVAPPPADTPAPPEPANAEPVEITPRSKKIKRAADTRLDSERANEEALALKAKLEKIRKEAENRRQETQRREAEQKRQQQLQERQRLAREKAEERRKEEVRRRQQEAARREEERQKILAARAEQERREAEQEAREAREQARAAREAFEAARAEEARRAKAQADARAANARREASSIVEQSYWGTVVAKIQEHWVLPEMRRWDPSLMAGVAITISRNGQVTSIQFQEHSQDPMFDQLVEKTIRAAGTMPPFPQVMDQQSTQLGIRFKPSGLN